MLCINEFKQGDGLVKENQKPIEVEVKNLKPGMFVSDVGRNWMLHPWPKQSKLITSENDIKQLKKYGIKRVTVDPARSQNLNSGSRDKNRPAVIQPEDRSNKSAQPVKSSPSARVSLEEELPRARKIYSSALNTVKDFVNDARAGKALNILVIQDQIEDMIESTIRNKDTVLAMMKLKKFDEYLFTHSLNVAVLAISLGNHMGYPRSQLMQLGLGGILHDLGKTGIPLNILNKPDKLTPEEFDHMKAHTTKGANILKGNKNISDEVISIVLSHHEKIDGNGYPNGLSGKALEPNIAITGMADVYDAISTDRVYHKHKLPHDALKTIFSLKGSQFEPVWVERFIQCMGIYPAGSLVRMNTKEIGLVTDTNIDTLMRPRVKILLDSNGYTLSKSKNCDLLDEGNQNKNIIEVLDPETMKIDVDALL